MHSGLKDMISILLQRRFAPSRKQDSRGMEAACTALLSESGDIGTVTIARKVLAKYRAMTAQEKLHFFRFLSEEFDLDVSAVEQTARAYRDDRTAGRLATLLCAAEPRRQELLRRLNRVGGATPHLVAMRCDLFDAIRTDPDLERIDLDFQHLLSSWFNPGFLVLKRIGWDSPASLLEKIIAYEAVHAIGDWNDLRRRVQPVDRRCFGYFHPSMPEEPLIFVEVALCNAVPTSIQSVLASDRPTLAPEEATTAVFYSISNCQRGLRGVSFGNSLIKQVVEDLSTEFPQLASFITLSPIPGFNRWLEAEGLANATPDRGRALATRYLVETKRADGFPHDSVARFHLANGAMVHDVHPNADLSENGTRQSRGMMVNYLYDPKRLEQNIDAYFAKRGIAHSGKLAQLLAHRN